MPVVLAYLVQKAKNVFKKKTQTPPTPTPTPKQPTPNQTRKET